MHMIWPDLNSKVLDYSHIGPQSRPVKKKIHKTEKRRFIIIALRIQASPTKEHKQVTDYIE